MTSSNLLHVVTDPSAPQVRLSAELLDMLAEAVVSCANEATRGAVAARLVREIYDSLAWLHPDPSHRERASFQRVVNEAVAHQSRLEGTPESTTVGYDGLRAALVEPEVGLRQKHHSNWCDRLVYGHKPCTCPRGDEWH